MAFSYIAGDIGGTNARLHLYSIPEKGDEMLITKENYKSNDFSSLTAVINQFLQDKEITYTPNAACFSVAGPVKNGNVNLTNLGWSLSESEMEEELGINRIIFLNDFAACGYGIKLLRQDELFEISPNRTPLKNAPKIIIGAGTGLGEAFMFESEDDFTVVPGEGGHTDFAPRNKTEFDLMIYIKKEFNLDRVGVERVVSGPGLALIYKFYCKNDPKLENPEVSSQIRNAVDPSMMISKFAIDHQDNICQKALKLFISCYGAEAGNMALAVLPAGGVYIAGGIAPKLCDVIKNDFLSSFYDKGRMRDLLASYPIYIVMNPSVGILGARFIARRHISENVPSINRNLSSSDIQSLSETVQLLSEEPKTDVKDKFAMRRNSNVVPISPNDIAKIQAAQKQKTEIPSTVNNLLWMGAGIGFTGLLLAAFFMGKNANDKK